MKNAFWHVGGAALVFSFGPALAAPAPAGVAAPSAPSQMDRLAGCRTVSDPAARLACYDDATAKLQEAIGRKEITVLDRQEVERTRRSLFGFTLPRFGIFKGEEQREITATIAGVRSLGRGLWELRLEGGGVWETLEANLANLDPRAGRKITIKQGALGNYFLKVDGDRPVRGRRIG